MPLLLSPASGALRDARSGAWVLPRGGSKASSLDLLVLAAPAVRFPAGGERERGVADRGRSVFFLFFIFWEPLVCFWQPDFLFGFFS
jgi:hypothetical protein